MPLTTAGLYRRAGRSSTDLDPHVRIPNAGKQFRILYSTVDGNGRPALSSGAVYLPDTPPPPGGYPLLAYAHGTAGIGDKCAPSTVEDLDPLIEDRSKWLRQGYALVASDYVGLGTPGLHDFLATQAAATSVTDALKRADFPVTDKWAVYGPSQGGQVALATARYATEPTRAAGLDFRGAVTTAPPANIETVLPAFGPDSPPFPLPSGLATFPLYVLNGVANEHPEANIESVLTPLGKQWLAKARELCVDNLGKALGDIDLRDFFTAPISSIPNIDAVLRDYMLVPFSGYDRPIFLGHGAVDTLAPIVTSLSLARTDGGGRTARGIPRLSDRRPHHAGRSESRRCDGLPVSHHVLLKEQLPLLRLPRASAC